jgi:fatty-acyl-CoA synthase
MNCTSEEMTEYIKSHMARHKVPKYVEFVDSFPMNAAGKIQKYKMREEAAARLGLTGDGSNTARSQEEQ